MDLKPREIEPLETAPAQRRKWGAIVALVLVLAAGGIIVTKFLTDSLDYYCNVEEVGKKSGCEADRALRIQGFVKEGTKRISNGITTFTIVSTENHVDNYPVQYDGVPSSEIFQDCVRVVVHGRLTNGVFLGDNVEVKHDNQYESADKAEQSTERSAACLQLRLPQP
ncbi:MAG: cytochrome c maturation protein CcmE [Ilumatobacteraceae bacterium]|jgi:cytochrome c-type biogenesis protein CcmE